MDYQKIPAILIGNATHTERKAYPRDVTADEWALVAPYLTTVVATPRWRAASNGVA